jgi:hypothetical protein
MATNVNAMERAASSGVMYHRFDDSGSDVKLTRVTSTPKTRDDVPPIEAGKPAGMAQMEAVTMVWTKKWLIAAYVL